MWYRVLPTCLVLVSLIWGAAGCKDKTASSADNATATEPAPEARKPPVFKDGPTGQNVSMSEMLAQARRQTGGAELPAGRPPIEGAVAPGHGGMAATLPAGHPPIGTMPAGHAVAGAGNLPAGHPPVGGGGDLSSEPQEPENMLQFNLPPTWTVRKTRPMTVAVYGLPKAEGDAEDAELAISHYPGMKDIPLDQQVKRWAGQFQRPDGTPTSDVVKQSKLENAAHPTTTIDISGRYRAGSMSMSGSTEIKDNYRMVVAYVETEEGPWFLRLVGPQATVAKHYDEFIKFAREAK
ncbi:MAG: hypothetical protein HY718_20065 [Planctomycetes bacterium]|nr:hypothetical protein [Planctomycetota bacterium]